jgi:hypothetical protein
MRPPVDVHPAASADPFPAIVIEGDRVLAFPREPEVDQVEHFQERHIGGNPVRLIFDEPPLVILIVLAPDVEFDIHDRFRWNVIVYL